MPKLYVSSTHRAKKIHRLKAFIQDVTKEAVETLLEVEGANLESLIEVRLSAYEDEEFRESRMQYAVTAWLIEVNARRIVLNMKKGMSAGAAELESGRFFLGLVLNPMRAPARVRWFFHLLRREIPAEELEE